MEFPRALKKSPTEPALTGTGTASRVATSSPVKIFFFAMFILGAVVWCILSACSMARRRREPFQGKKIDPMPSGAVEGQVRGDLSDNRRELEAMAGESAAKDHVRVLRMAIDHEIAVGREAIHAGLCFAQSSRRPRHPFFHRARDRLNVAPRVDLAIQLVGGS